MGPQLSADALTVLRALLERAMDGYTLQSRTELNRDRLRAALDELQNQSLVMLKGTTTTSTSVGEAYVYVPPEAKRYAEFILGLRPWARTS